MEGRIKGSNSGSPNIREGVTEIFVTQVNPANENAFKEWIEKIHNAEAKFSGFRGVYVQCPKIGVSKNWITLLQFDTPENLERWLTSPERKSILKESISVVSSLESHRLISPYEGWFSSVSVGTNAPSIWKQTMIILLVLFPVVMLEMKFLNPWTRSLNFSLATFIGNAISVTLVSWPLMPIAIRYLNFWLLPDPQSYMRDTIVGTIVVVGLYILEIGLLWNLL